MTTNAESLFPPKAAAFFLRSERKDPWRRPRFLWT